MQVFRRESSGIDNFARGVANAPQKSHVLSVGEWIADTFFAPKQSGDKKDYPLEVGVENVFAIKSAGVVKSDWAPKEAPTQLKMTPKSSTQ
ncbi:MAG: hypothetical protein ACRCZF_14680 [Gemmataceae bacterium]